MRFSLQSGDTYDKIDSTNHQQKKAVMLIMECKFAKLGCGGCEALQLPYAEQLRTKQQTVEKLLGSFGPVKPILGAEDPLHYRCKVISTFAADRDGRLTGGLYVKDTHRVLPTENCLLEDERAGQIAAAVRRCAARCRYTAYDEDRRTGLLRHVVVRRGAGTGQIMVILVTAQAILPGSRNFVALLRESCPDVTTVIQNVNEKESSAVLGNVNKVLYGPGHIEDTLCGCRFLISPGSFYQINPAQTEHLYRCAVEAAALHDGDRVLDAYCGTGTIGLVAAKNGAGEVLGVESSRPAVQDAIANARRNGIRNARFVAADAGRFMTELTQRQEDAPDVVFMDPPRAGSDRAFLTALLRLAPKKIVYVSCNPETQARDMKTLIGGGYRVASIQPIDLFPFTAHTEVVVSMTRGNDREDRSGKTFRKNR